MAAFDLRSLECDQIEEPSILTIPLMALAALLKHGIVFASSSHALLLLADNLLPGLVDRLYGPQHSQSMLAAHNSGNGSASASGKWEPSLFTIDEDEEDPLRLPLQLQSRSRGPFENKEEHDRDRDSDSAPEIPTEAAAAASRWEGLVSPHAAVASLAPWSALWRADSLLSTKQNRAFLGMFCSRPPVWVD